MMEGGINGADKVCAYVAELEAPLRNRGLTTN